MTKTENNCCPLTGEWMNRLWPITLCNTAQQGQGTNCWYSHDVGESQLCHSKWRKPAPKGHILHGSVYMTSWKIPSYRPQKWINIVRGWVGKREEWWHRNGRVFCIHGIFLYFDFGGLVWLCICKTQDLLYTKKYEFYSIIYT